MSEAFRLFKEEAEQGHAEAQLALGRYYIKGELVEKDEAEAVEWFKKAAEQGNPLAQFFLSHHLRMGIGVDKNEQEANKWVRESAKQGCDYAIEIVEHLESIGAKSGNDKKNIEKTLIVIYVGTPDLDDYNFVCKHLDVILSKSSNLIIAVPTLYKQGAELLFRRYSTEKSYPLDVFELPVNSIAEFQKELHKTIDRYTNPSENSHGFNDSAVALVGFGETDIVRATCQVAKEREVKHRIIC